MNNKDVLKGMVKSKERHLRICDPKKAVYKVLKSDCDALQAAIDCMESVEKASEILPEKRDLDYFAKLDRVKSIGVEDIQGILKNHGVCTEWIDHVSNETDHENDSYLYRKNIARDIKAKIEGVVK